MAFFSPFIVVGAGVAVWFWRDYQLTKHPERMDTKQYAELNERRMTQ